MVSPEVFVKHIIEKIDYQRAFPDHAQQKATSLQQFLEIIPRIVQDPTLPTHLYSPLYLDMMNLISENPQSKKEVADIPTKYGLARYRILAWQYGHQPSPIQEKLDYPKMVHSMIQKHGSFTQVYLTTLWSPTYRQNLCGSMGIFHCTREILNQEQGLVVNVNENLVENNIDPFTFLPLVSGSIGMDSSFRMSVLENPFRFQIRQKDGNWLTFYPIRTSETEASFFTRYIVNMPPKPKKELKNYQLKKRFSLSGI